MRFETLQRMLENGERPKIFVVERTHPLTLMTGYAIKAYVNDCKRVALEPFTGLNVYYGRLPGGGNFDSETSQLHPYQGLILEPGNISFTTSFRQHSKDAIGLAYEIIQNIERNRDCGTSEKCLDSVLEYLRAANALKEASDEEVRKALRKVA